METWLEVMSYLVYREDEEEESPVDASAWKPVRLMAPAIQQTKDLDSTTNMQRTVGSPLGRSLMQEEGSWSGRHDPFPKEMDLLQEVSLSLLDPKGEIVENEFALRRLSFLALSTEVMLDCDCEVSYAGSDCEDVVLKVFKGADPRHLQSYEFVGHVHAMQGAKRTVRIKANGASYYLGLELLRGLNKQRTQEELRQRAPLVTGRLEGLGRAEESDFLIVFCSRDPSRNTTWLRHLSEIGPRSGPWDDESQAISFCTDLSVGLGAHYGDVIDLHLGRYGFGREPPAEGADAWFREFAEVARLTRYGALMINISPQYFQSRECDAELFDTDEERRFVYMHMEDRIVPAAEYRRMMGGAIHPVITAAMKSDYFGIVDALRDDVDWATKAVDKRGHSSLAHAAKNGLIDATREILHHRADVGGTCYLGVSALHMAAAHGQLEAAKKLLQARANLNGRDDRLGYTPLHEAARVGRSALVEHLLDARADLLGKDSKGQTALDLAMLEGHLTVVEICRSRTVPESEV